MIEVGSVVYLKRDPIAQPMTVGQIEEEKVACYLWNTAGKQEVKRFPLMMLSLENPHPPIGPVAIDRTRNILYRP